jgi:hypothetical protein
MCTAGVIGWDRDPQPPPPPPQLSSYARALLVSQDRRHLFVTPWFSRIGDFLNVSLSGWLSLPRNWICFSLPEVYFCLFLKIFYFALRILILRVDKSRLIVPDNKRFFMATFVQSVHTAGYWLWKLRGFGQPPPPLHPFPRQFSLHLKMQQHWRQPLFLEQVVLKN